MTHEAIISKLAQLPLVYWCLGDEIGEREHTPHTHIYIVARNSVRFDTVKKQFGKSHIEKAVSSSSENRDYIRKSGKWESTEKATTSLPNTFVEWGELPDDARPVRNERTNRNEELMQLIGQGYSTAQILAQDNSLALCAAKVEQLRGVMTAHKAKSIVRDIHIVYICCQNDSLANKYVYSNYPLQDVCRISHYPMSKGMRFDGYTSEPVILFSRFSGQIPLDEFLSYCSPYPTELPARYRNANAAFDTVIISSPLAISDIYREHQQRSPELWGELLDMVAKVILIFPDGNIEETLFKGASNEQTE